MSTEFDTAKTRQFMSGVQLLAQQKKSRLGDCVRFEPLSSADRAAFDQIGATAAQKRTQRHADTPIMNTPHRRRWVAPDPYDWADLIDKEDQIRALNDFANPYMMAGAAAMGRAMDDVIIAAAFATAVTGENGDSTVQFDSNYTIAANNSGLTLAKLLEAKEMLDAAENDDPEDPLTKRYIAVTAKQLTNLFNTTEVKSAEYNSVKALVKGEINEFLGFTFKRTQRLQVTSGQRRVIAWCRNSLLLGVNQSPKSRISERADKNYATQVYVNMDIGATRMDETGVVEIRCTE